MAEWLKHLLSKKEFVRSRGPGFKSMSGQTLFDQVSFS